MSVDIRQETLPVKEAEVKKEISNLLAFARGLIVHDESAFKSITDIYAKAREMEKLVKARLEETNAPFQERLNANKDAAQSFLDPIKEIIAVCNAQTNQYRQLLQEQKRVEEERIRAAAIALDAPVPYIAPVAKTIRGAGATSITKKKLCFELTDIEKVPKRYLQLNEKAVEYDLKLGVEAIEGLRIWEETRTELRTR